MLSFDLVGFNGSQVILIEVKSRLQEKDLEGNVGVYMARIMRDSDRNGNGRLDEGDFN